ncbi:hypothetical protein ABBQ32_012253 [Trebouxia sp. C0010 RCD-2024]
MDLASDLWQDWPCRLVNNVDQGRYLVATKDLKSSKVVLLSEAYLAALIPSFKKRICHFCLVDHQHRLETSCILKRFSSIKCDPGMESVIRMCLDAMALQYLQNTCHPSHSTTTALSTSNQLPPGYQHNPQELPGQVTHRCGPQTPTPQQAPPISPSLPPPHNAIQQQLQGMSMQSWPYQTAKQSCGDSSGQPDECVRHSSPSSIAEACVSTSHTAQTQPESLESTQAASASSSCQDLLVAEPPAAQLPCLTHAHLIMLQSHAADFTDKDRRDWLVSLRFLRAAMQHAHWPGDIWSEDALLDMVGRIASNNFGTYSTRQRQPQQPVTPSKFCEPLAVPDEAASCQSQCLLRPKSTLPNSDEQAACSQMQSSFYDSSQQQTLQHPSSSSPHASKQPLSCQADAGPTAEPRGLLPWPLQAEAQIPLPSPTQTPGAEDGTPQRSSLTVDRPRDHQPLLPGSSVQTCDRTAPSKDELLSKKPSRICVQQPPARQKPAKEDVVGREMYITASFFNHSCEPNCIKHRLLGQQSGIATVTALRDIKAGEPLTISYIDLELPRSARQLELKTCFFFDCKCARCEISLPSIDAAECV